MVPKGDESRMLERVEAWERRRMNPKASERNIGEDKSQGGGGR